MNCPWTEMRIAAKEWRDAKIDLRSGRYGVNRVVDAYLRYRRLRNRLLNPRWS
jgi:hypothetical protein